MKSSAVERQFSLALNGLKHMHILRKALPWIDKKTAKNRNLLMVLGILLPVVSGVQSFFLIKTHRSSKRNLAIAPRKAKQAAVTVVD